MEAALSRLNPHLNQIGNLEKGTPILVPDNITNGNKESTPLFGNTEELLQQCEIALKNVRAAFEESLVEAGEQSERVQMWLKGDQAKEILRRAPELKETFSSAATAAKSLRKEQATLIAAEEKALSTVQAALASFLETSRR